METTEEKTKVCRNCQLELPLRCFYKDTGFKDGLKARCIKCDNIRRCSTETSERLLNKALEKPYLIANQLKRCPRCNIVKSVTEFTMNNARDDKLDAYCKSCGKILAKEIYNDKRKPWIEYFKSRYGENPSCECCGKILRFDVGLNNKSFLVHFDHRNGGDEVIKRAPSSWLPGRAFSQKNIDIWESCNWGILCNQCNVALPTKDREVWMQQAWKYVFGSHDHELSNDRKA